MTNLVDSYLLFRIRTKRDPEAFARIYDRYVEAIYRFAILKLPGAEEAQDVTSETFTKALQYICEQKEIENIRALLYRIVRNLIADFYRKKTRTVALEESVTFEGEIASTEVHAEVGDSGQGKRIIEARADFALIIQKLERLKEDYRDVLMLRLVDDLPFQVIGEILEKAPGHVRVIYHRALKALNDLDGGNNANA